jgi:hypothetical protein
MTWADVQIPSYDPATAANVFAGVALLISILSYRLSRKTALAREDAERPDVHAIAAALAKHPGWVAVRLKITNHLPNDLELSEIRLRWPARALGIAESAALVASPSYGRELPKEIPINLAARRFSVARPLGPRGATRGQSGINPAATEWTTIYVRAERSTFARNLHFSIVFSLRKTDVRRFKRIVSKQRIELPMKQAA